MNLSQSLSSAILPLLVIPVVVIFASYLVVEKNLWFITPALAGLLILLIGFFNMKITLSLLTLSMLLSPEFGAASTAQRAVTIRLDDLLLLVTTVSWLLRMAIFKDYGFIRKTSINGSLLALCGCMALSTTLGVFRGNVNPLTGFFFVAKIIEYFVVFAAVINYSKSIHDIHWLLTLSIVTCACTVIYAMSQVAMGGDIAAPFEGSVGEKNTLGGYLAFMGTIITGIALKTKNSFESKIMWILLILLTSVLVLSLSRSGWMAYATGMSLILIRTGHWKAVIFFAIVAAIALPQVMPEEAQERFMYTFTQEQAAHRKQFEFFGIRLDTSTSARIYSYLEVFNQFLKHPFFGFGITGYSFIDGQFFRFLNELGLVGFAVFNYMLFKVHGQIRKSTKEQGDMRLHGMTLGMQAAFWGLIVHALSANSFMIVRIAEPFWCLMGLTTAYSAFAKSTSLDTTKVMEKKYE